MKNFNSLFQINLSVLEHNSSPCIQLRVRTTNINEIKLLIYAALNEQPIIILPHFNNKLKSICSLIDKGIIAKIEDDYDFLI